MMRQCWEKLTFVPHIRAVFVGLQVWRKSLRSASQWRREMRREQAGVIEGRQDRGRFALCRRGPQARHSDPRLRRRMCGRTFGNVVSKSYNARPCVSKTLLMVDKHITKIILPHAILATSSYPHSSKTRKSSRKHAFV